MKKKKEKKPFVIRVISIKEQKDGSAILNFEYDETFYNTVSVLTGIKQPTKKDIRKFVLDGLKKSIKQMPKK